MPVNRFDQSVATTTPYTSLYSPMPLQALTDLAKDHSNRFRSALDDINTTKGLLDIKADPRNVAYRDNYVAAINNKLTDLTGRIVKEGYTPELQNEWFRTKNAIVSDPDRLALANAYKNYEIYQKDKITNTDKSVFSDIYDTYKGQGDPNKVTPYDYTGMKVKQDYIPIMDKAIDGLKADSRTWEGYIKDSSGRPIVNEFGQLTKSNGEKEELSGAKLKQIASIVAPTFFQSKESQYYIDEAFGRPMPSFNELPKQAQEALLANATNDIIRRGSTQLFNQTKSGVDLQNLPEHALDKIDAENLTTSTQSEGLNGNNTINPIVKDMQFDSKGNFIIPKTAEYINNDKLYGENAGIRGIGKKVGEREDLNKMAEQVKFVTNIQQQHPDLKGLTPKATIEAYNKAHKALSSESIPLESISNVAAENIADGIVRNKLQRNFYIIDSKGKTEDGTFKTVLDKLGISEQEFDQQLAGNKEKGIKSAIGGYSQAGPIAGAYYAEIKDDNGESRRIMISPDTEMQQTFRTSQAINEARKSLTPTKVIPVPEIPNYQILVNPSISKDGVTNWKYIEIITDNDGNVVKSNPTTLTEIRKAEKNHLKTSGYLGSDIGILKPHTTE